MSPPAGRITPCFGGPTFRPPDPGGESCAGDHTGPAGEGRRRLPPHGYRLTVIASNPGKVRVTSPRSPLCPDTGTSTALTAVRPAPPASVAVVLMPPTCHR